MKKQIHKKDLTLVHKNVISIKIFRLKNRLKKESKKVKIRLCMVFFAIKRIHFMKSKMHKSVNT